MEVQPQVCWARATLDHVYDYWQHLQRNGLMLQTSIKVISSKKNKMIAVAWNSKKGSSFGFFVIIMVKDKFAVPNRLPAGLSIAKKYVLIGL